MALAHQSCTPTGTSANGNIVSMAFTVSAPDGTGPFNGSVSVPAFDNDGYPLSPSAVQNALIVAARWWYVEKFGQQAIAPAVPAAFQIN